MEEFSFLKLFSLFSFKKKKERLRFDKKDMRVFSVYLAGILYQT